MRPTLIAVCSLETCVPAYTHPQQRNEAKLTVAFMVMGVTGALAVNSDRALPSSEMYQLDIVLKRGHNLAIRDRGGRVIYSISVHLSLGGLGGTGLDWMKSLSLSLSLSGTSDPYVKFKLCGKEVFRSKTIHKNLNPVWDEGTKLLVDSLQEPLYVKVFDYDFGLQDDFMGSAYLYLESLEQQRAIPVTLTLQDPHYPDVDLGTLELTVTLRPKDGSIEEPHRDATVSVTPPLTY
uniref:Multiple C2 and transmembrane domain containing 1 n=1 Tax=Hucho hucho TaxID=62062 RepID=A0A4W5MGY5_9TELE